MNRVNTVIILPDVHCTEKGFKKPYLLVRKFLKEFKPDITVLLGDFMNMDALCRHTLGENKKRLVENKRYRKECDVANNELDFLDRYSKKIIYLEGNHENWVEQYIDAHPEVEGDFELPLKLHLKERDIPWIPLNHLYKLGQLYLTHGLYTSKFHAYKHLITFGCNICYGHTHNAQTAMINMKIQEPFMSWGLGCLCDHEPSYLEGKPANWINQFAVVHLHKGGNFQLTPINIIDNRFFFGGKWYE